RPPRSARAARLRQPFGRSRPQGYGDTATDEQSLRVLSTLSSRLELQHRPAHHARFARADRDVTIAIIEVMPTHAPLSHGAGDATQDAGDERKQYGQRESAGRRTDAISSAFDIRLRLRRQ